MKSTQGMEVCTLQRSRRHPLPPFFFFLSFYHFIKPHSSQESSTGKQTKYTDYCIRFRALTSITNIINQWWHPAPALPSFWRWRHSRGACWAWLESPPSWIEVRCPAVGACLVPMVTILFLRCPPVLGCWKKRKLFKKGLCIDDYTGIGTPEAPAVIFFNGWWDLKEKKKEKNKPPFCVRLRLRFTIEQRHTTGRLWRHLRTVRCVW